MKHEIWIGIFFFQFQLIILELIIFDFEKQQKAINSSVGILEKIHENVGIKESSRSTSSTWRRGVLRSIPIREVFSKFVSGRKKSHSQRKKRTNRVLWCAEKKFLAVGQANLDLSGRERENLEELISWSKRIIITGTSLFDFATR